VIHVLGGPIIDDHAADEHAMAHGILSGALLAFDRAVGERHWPADSSLRKDDIVLNSRIERGCAWPVVKCFILRENLLVNGTMGRQELALDGFLFFTALSRNLYRPLISGHFSIWAGGGLRFS
jgi:hypothetical protein